MPGDLWQRFANLRLLFFFLWWFFVIRQVQVGGKQALSFGRSKAKMVDEKKKKTTFADVAGCEESKEELREVVDFLKTPDKYQKLGRNVENVK